MEREARREGVRVSADMFPYPVAATMMYAIYPPWALEGGPGELLARLRDRETRARIGKDIEEQTPEWPPWEPEGWPHNLVSAVGWGRIRVSSVGSEAGRDALGRSLADLGSAAGTEPFEAISDLMLAEDGAVGQFVLDISGEDGLHELASDPEVAFITDANDYGRGSPHPRRLRRVPAGAPALRARGRNDFARGGGSPDDLASGRHRRARGPGPDRERTARGSRSVRPGSSDGPRHPRTAPRPGHRHPRHLRERTARDPRRPLHRRAARPRAPAVGVVRIRHPRLRSLVAAGLMFAILVSGCSIVLTQGPPKPGESDYDATGAYPDGVPCTSSRMWPLVDLGLMLWVLALTVNYDNRDDQIDGSLTAAAAAISTWIGYRRTKACRDSQTSAGARL